MTAPGEDPICFDVDTESENILALFADGSSALEINAQFKVRLPYFCSINIFSKECEWRFETIYESDWFYKPGRSSNSYDRQKS